MVKALHHVRVQIIKSIEKIMIKSLKVKKITKANAQHRMVREDPAYRPRVEKNRVKYDRKRDASKNVLGYKIDENTWYYY